MLKKLRQQKADAMAKANAINALADKENRVPTGTEATDFNDLMASVAKLNENIIAQEALVEAERIAPATAAAPEAAKKPWASFGEQLKAVRDVAVSGGRNTDPRLFAALGANEGVPAEGGFLVAPEYASGILQKTYDVGQVASRAFKMPMSSSRLIMNAVDEDSRADGSRWGGIQAYWQSEASSYTGTKPKFREMQLTANKLIGLCYVTEEQLEDGPALQKYIESAFPDEFAFKIDDAILNGSGAGQPLGIQSSGAVIVQAKDSGQATGTISTTNVLNMFSRLHTRSMATAAWLINQNVLPQLWQLTLGSGAAARLIYNPPGVNGDTSPAGSLLGRPVVVVEQAASLSTQGDINLFDLQQYLLAERSGLRADSSIHVAFLTGEQAFRFMLRLDGQPMWKKPLTPKNGTSTLSPFITLQAR